MCEKLKVSIELQQVRGAVDGKTRYNGVTIHSTEENIKAEMRDVFARIVGQEGREIRIRLAELRETYVRSHREGSHAAMVNLGRFASDRA